MKVVIDTNVLVSGLLSPYGKPAAILRLMILGKIQLCYDARIISEYREVLLRAKFRFDRYKIDMILDHIESFGEIITARPLKISLPDPDDNPFLEVAMSRDVEYLITGNVIHYPRKICKNIHVVKPAEFIKAYTQI